MTIVFIVLLGLYLILFVPFRGQTLLQFFIRGPIVKKQTSDVGEYIQYANSRIELHLPNGDIRDMEEELYVKKRDWLLLTSSNGSGDVIRLHRTYDDMIDYVTSLGVIVTLDIITGMVYYKPHT